jgi:hypothetical protein
MVEISLLNVYVRHKVLRINRTHGIRSINVVFVGGIRCWPWIDFSPLASTLAGGPFLCGAKFEHLCNLAQAQESNMYHAELTFWAMMSNLLCTQYSCAIRRAFTSTSVQTRMRSLSRLRRICRAGI